MDTDRQPKIDGHRLSEFIYGTVTGMVAIAGVSVGSDTSWLKAATIIVVGAVAIWAAHGYSIMISKRVTAGRRLTGAEIYETLAGSWPIVLAGCVLAIPLLPVAVGLWGVAFALRISSLLGVVLLAGTGLLAGAITHERWPRRLLLAVLSGGLGLAVVAVELLLSHH